MKMTEPVKLAQPGAGLPLPELLLARMFMRFKRMTLSRDQTTALFVAERAAVRSLVDQCAVEVRGNAVLLPRPRFLEDSSRCWSVWMTLDHLRITNDGFNNIIGSLVKGHSPTKRLSIADVKPNPDVTSDVDAAYEQSCSLLLERLAECEELKTALKYAHPWFGPMNAAGWHTLAAIHMGIHRGQIRNILAQRSWR